MAKKPNYNFEKNKKEQKRQAKREAKLEEKLRRKEQNAPREPLPPSDPTSSTWHG